MADVFLDKLKIKPKPKQQEEIKVEIKKPQTHKEVVVKTKIIDKRISADINRQALLAKIKGEIITEVKIPIPTPVPKLKEKNESSIDQDPIVKPIQKKLKKLKLISVDDSIAENVLSKEPKEPKEPKVPKESRVTKKTFKQMQEDVIAGEETLLQNKEILEKLPKKNIDLLIHASHII